MKLIVQLVGILTIVCQLVPAQGIDESHLKCSRGKTAKAMIINYTAQTLAQNDYDVNFYDIDIKIDPSDSTISGTVGVQGKSLIASLNIVELDLNSVLNVESVKNDQDVEMNYTHNSNLLTITLDNPVNNGNSFSIIIDYNGKPQSSGFGSFGFSHHNGEPMIWSLSEPYGARDWWPCKDTPNDKADSVDISLKVPSELIAASNGTLIDTIINGDWATYHWQERYPIATYLVSVAIHPYKVFYDWYYTPTDTMRLEYYVFPDNFDAVQDNYSLTKDMLNAMVQRFGEYPFIKEKYGHAEFVAPVGGMEHQTLTSLGGYSEGLIAHELGHQWWGDMVTCANFHHIWLNEGFATYSEALWYEIRDNDIQSLHNEMAGNANYYFNYPEGRYNFDDSRLFVADTSNIQRIFDYSLSYSKASWVVHMLRHVVGDSAFFNGLLEYGNRYRFKSAVTEQFQTVLEEVSGKDLESFFQRWIYGELYPIYEVVYSQSDNNLLMQITQIQGSDIFIMPIDIKATYIDESESTWVVDNSLRQQFYSLIIPDGKTIQKLELDPDNWILKKISEIRLDILGNSIIPGEFCLHPVYPNPFNAGVTIRFDLENEGEVHLKIFDIIGNQVWQQSGDFVSGAHFIKWDGKDQLGNKIPSGTYVVEVNNGILIKKRKMLLLK